MKQSKLHRVMVRAMYALTDEPEEEVADLVYEARSVKDKIEKLFLDTGEIKWQDIDHLVDLLDKIKEIRFIPGMNNIYKEVVIRSDAFKDQVKKYEYLVEQEYMTREVMNQAIDILLGD